MSIHTVSGAVTFKRVPANSEPTIQDLLRHTSGMAYGELGPTHHSIEDFAWMRVLPNLPPAKPVLQARPGCRMKWRLAWLSVCH